MFLGLEISPTELISELNLLFAGIAAAVGFVILWYTVLKGPDISPVRTITLAFPEPSQSTQATLPFDTLELNPVDLVFVNSGSKSGAITELTAEYESSQSFQRFFSSPGQSAMVKSSTEKEAGKSLPVVIPERGTVIVTLTLWFRMKPWKNMSRLAQLKHLSLEEALKLIWKEGIETLKAFSELKSEVGTLEFRFRRTKGRLFRIRLSYASISTERLGALPAWATEKARIYLEKFSDLRPTDAEVAQRIRQLALTLLGECENHEKILARNIQNEQDLRSAQLSTYSWDQTLEGAKWGDPYWNVLLHQEGLLQKLRNYYQKVKDYNNRIQAVADTEIEMIGKLRTEFQKESSNIHSELVAFQTKIVAGTAHLLA